MAKPYELYYREGNDFVFYANALPPDGAQVMLVAFYKPLGKGSHTIWTRREWDESGYDARQYIWSLLAHRAK